MYSCKQKEVLYRADVVPHQQAAAQIAVLLLFAYEQAPAKVDSARADGCAYTSVASIALHGQLCF